MCEINMFVVSQNVELMHACMHNKIFSRLFNFFLKQHMFIIYTYTQYTKNTVTCVAVYFKDEEYIKFMIKYMTKMIVSL